MPELHDRLQSALGDSYRLEREIGGGGMSRLFLATEASLNRQVVIKLLPPEMTSEVSAARFKQEIELAAHLQHPNILPVLTAGAQDDLIYYVMPYVAGESLRHRLTAHGRLPVDDVRKILAEVSDALAYAHAQGVVHRDIKPENILLEHGHAVLTDFGVARAVAEAQSGERLTQTGMSVGTPGYMSPEQAAGEHHIDARADVYSVAVVGYEMLTGQQPFTGPSIQAVLAAHLTETPRPVQELRQETPPEIATTIAKALAKNPRERLQSAAEFRDAVAVTSGVTPAVAPGRRRWVAIGGVAAAAAIAAVLLWPRGWSVEGDPRRSLIVFPFENRTGDQAHDWLQEASMNLLGLSLSQWEDLRVFDDERTSSLMRRRDVTDAAAIDFDAAQAMARDAHVGTLVIGDIRRDAAELAVEAKVHDVASGDRLMTEVVRASLDADPRPLFDSLAGRILRISGAPPGERPGVIAQTTTSVEAYRAYLEGAAQIQRLALDSAEQNLLRAVHLDTTFALAYIQLRNAEGWKDFGDEERARLYAIEAERHSERLPPRLRSLVQYHVAFANGDLRRARGIAEQLVARDSSDVEAWYQLGEAHYHHGSTVVPRSDTLGDWGQALRAFERTLALDSNYVLVYFHLTQTWGGCASPSARFVCLPDSTVYGMPDDLRTLLGTAEVDRLRNEAAAQQLAVGYAWVEQVPNAVRAREILGNALLEQERYPEAENQAAVLRTLGHPRRAAVLGAQALYGQRRYREAGARASEAVTGLTHAEEFGGIGQAAEILATAGRTADARRAGMLVWDAFASADIPVGETPGGVAVTLPRSAYDSIVGLWFTLSPYTTDSALVSGRAWQVSEIAQQALRDTAAYGVFARADFESSLPLYVQSGDTTLLAHYVGHLLEGTRPDARALLALARGDSGSARRLLREHFDPRTADPAAWTYEDAVAAWAWATLLERLGRIADAVDVYAMFERTRFTRQYGAEVVVRSWAQRGALYRELGDRGKAIEMYEKFIDALSEGDASVQDVVDRARRAIAALKGETAGVQRR